MNAQKWRVAAGIAVLLILAAIGVRLAPPYLENWKLQQYVNHVAADPVLAAAPVDAIRADIIRQAASLGLPVQKENVEVTHSGGGLQINVMYVVRIDLPAYTVDLHFRPAAGGT